MSVEKEPDGFCEDGRTCAALSCPILGWSQEGETPFKELLPPLHVGSVAGLDACIRRPLVATCGADRTLRLWNYGERTVEQYKGFGEEVFAAAFHPSGSLLVLGLATKLRLYSVLHEDIRCAGLSGKLGQGIESACAFLSGLAVGTSLLRSALLLCRLWNHTSGPRILIQKSSRTHI